MKATGIVRRIDDLGRVVIPKEIRRTMRIREGDPLEIFTTNEGEVVFKKYSAIGELAGYTAEYAEVLFKVSGTAAIICDNDHVVAAAGIPKKEVLERRVSQALEDIMKQRRTINCKDKNESRIKPIEGFDRYALVCYPIIASSEVYGAVMFISNNAEENSDEVRAKLIETAAGFMSKQIET